MALWKETASKRRERRYGLTKERYTSIMKEQKSLCAICNLKPPTDVDHNSKNGNFRGLLCRSCNLGLGMFADNPELLQKAIQYLDKPSLPLKICFPKKSTKGIPRSRGENCHSSKLTDEIVRSIRLDYNAGGVSYNTLSKKYGIHPTHLGLIVRGGAWQHVK